jgi:hypothetical protein
MASTYSPSLRLELIGDGDQSGIWGQTTNNNLGYLIEQSVAGVITITMADANYTLSNYNGVVDEARNQVLVMSGALTATRNVIAPLVEKTYIVKNSTTGSQSIQIIGSSGLGVTIPNGVTALVYCDGTNFYNALTGLVGNFTVNGNLSVTGNETVTGTLGVTGATSLTTGSISGIVTAPTATAGTNTTQLATTAFVGTAVTAATGSLGTMSTQNANNVAITGGSITGITDLAVADGGTGRSTLTANAVLTGNGTSGINSVSPSTAGNLLVSNGTTWTSATLASSGVKLGLGITGEVWNDVASGRGFGSTYTNSNAYPIAVSATATCAVTSEIHAYVNGVLIAWYQWQYNGCGSFGGTFIIVPPGATYRLDSGQGVYQWKELY